MDSAQTRRIASEWLEAWNNRDLTKVMEHYADDCELYSPFVAKSWNIAEGTLRGKEKIREHFVRSFESASGKIELLEILTGVGELLLVFGSDNKPVSANLVSLNDAGKVKSVKAFYL